MAYVYLLDMYEFIEKRLADASEALEKDGRDTPDKSRQQGRIDTLTQFQDFLKENFNPKLPRRIRQAYFEKKDWSKFILEKWLNDAAAYRRQFGNHTSKIGEARVNRLIVNKKIVLTIAINFCAGRIAYTGFHPETGYLIFQINPVDPVYFNN